MRGEPPSRKPEVPQETTVPKTTLPDQRRCASTDPVEAPLALEGFRVERPLGRGGMGSVYLARSEATGEAFAVKRIHAVRTRDPRYRQAFFQELVHWSDLPEHPHLTAFRFFRMAGEEILIFAELVEGGSLGSWLRKGRLEDPARILRVAIQTAWGLQAIHRWGLIHRDVKPGNILMTPEGSPKVTDFGLAQAGGAHPEWAGGTPAFWSPEQAAGAEPTPRSDLWSWGLTVLAMFSGGATWASGLLAPEILETCAELHAAEEKTVLVPAAAVPILRRCLHRDPSRRWASLEEAAEALLEILAELPGGEAPPRPTPVHPPPRPEEGSLDRQATWAGVWRDPRTWLHEIAPGASPGSARHGEVEPGRGRRSRLIADLATLTEARRIYEERIAAGETELRRDLAEIHLDTIRVQSLLGDLPGSLARIEVSIALLSEIVAEGDGAEDRSRLVYALGNKGGLLWLTKRHPEALEALDEALAIWRGGDPAAISLKGWTGVAWVHLNRGNALKALGRLEESIRAYDEAIAIYERTVDLPPEESFEHYLADTLMNRAGGLATLGRLEETLPDFRRAVAIYERKVLVEGELRHEEGLARALGNTGGALRSLDRHEEALETLDRSLEIYARLIEEGRSEYRSLHAWFAEQKGIALRSLGRPGEAAALQEEAVRVYHRQVHQEGRQEQRADLASALSTAGQGRIASGEPLLALRHFRSAERLLVELLREGHRELEVKLSMVRCHLAHALILAGREEEGRRLGRRSLEALEQEARTNRTEGLRDTLAWAREELAPLLN